MEPINVFWKIQNHLYFNAFQVFKSSCLKYSFINMYSVLRNHFQKIDPYLHKIPVYKIFGF